MRKFVVLILIAFQTIARQVKRYFNIHGILYVKIVQDHALMKPLILMELVCSIVEKKRMKFSRVNLMKLVVKISADLLLVQLMMIVMDSLAIKSLIIVLILSLVS